MALDVLAHELVHAAVGVQHGHKAPFKRVAVAIGLTGKMTIHNRRSGAQAKLEKIYAMLGDFPYGAFDGSGQRQEEDGNAACQVRMPRMRLHGAHDSQVAG